MEKHGQKTAEGKGLKVHNAQNGGTRFMEFMTILSMLFIIYFCVYTACLPLQNVK